MAALADLNPPDDIRVYLNANTAPGNLRLPGNPVCIPRRRFWTMRTLTAEMRRSPPDLLFVPSYVIPPIHPPSVVTIHDLGYLIEPECHQPWHRKQLEWSTRWNTRAATGIVAVSHATKRDLIERLEVDSASIQVVHHGISPRFARASVPEIESIQRRYGIGNRMILAVGSIHPRKNLHRLIQAFEHLAASDAELQLVLCGGLGWQGDSIVRRAASSPFHQRILRLGYLPDRELPALYSSASVFVFPSLYEGFGMPLLEAMACGTPVVAANRSALPEIAGNAAVLVDPTDSEAIAGGIQRLLSETGLRQTMVERGFQRVHLFSWRNCATETLAFLRSISDNKGRKARRTFERGRE